MRFAFPGAAGEILRVGFAAIGVALLPGLLLGQTWSNGSGGAIYYNGGYVGIGTSTPPSRLTVVGADSDGIALISNGTTNGVRIGSAFGIGWVQGVDSTGFTSFQPLDVGGSYVRFDISNSEKVRIDTTGNVGIGTTAPQYKLSVNGTIGAQEVIVTNTGWSDYVFKPDYRLRPLSEVAGFIRENHHLPDTPTEAEVQEKGIGLGEMQTKLLAKVEELTLHMIQADARNNRLEQQNQELQQRIAKLEATVATRGTRASVSGAGKLSR
jgi:hypothetical protein